MIKQYKKDSEYSYTGGFFPTFELLNNRKNQLINVYASPESLDTPGYLKLEKIVPKNKIIVSKNIFDKLKEKDNDHVIGVFNKYKDKLEKHANHVVLVNPSDMGNLGNIMRSMLAFNYLDLALITPCADYFNPKVIRSSMGAVFSLRIQTFKSFDEYMKDYKRPYYPFMLKGSTSLTDVKKVNGNYALVFGNEATGLPDSFTNNLATRIEQSKKVDSLNLATAVVVALYSFKYFKN